MGYGMIKAIHKIKADSKYERLSGEKLLLFASQDSYLSSALFIEIRKN